MLPMDILFKIKHMKILLTLIDPCVDLDCDHMCLNTKPEPKCLCADGYVLDDDEETCIGNYHLMKIYAVGGFSTRTPVNIYPTDSCWQFKTNEICENLKYSVHFIVPSDIHYTISFFRKVYFL